MSLQVDPSSFGFKLLSRGSFVKNPPGAALNETSGAAWVRNLISSLIPWQSSPQDSWCMLQQLPATVNVLTSWRQGEIATDRCVWACLCVWVCIFLVYVTSRARNSPGRTSQTAYCGDRWRAWMWSVLNGEAAPTSQPPAISHMWSQPEARSFFNKSKNSGCG